MNRDIVLLLNECFSKVFDGDIQDAEKVKREFDSIMVEASAMFAELDRIKSEVAVWRASAAYGLRPLNADAGRYLDEACLRAGIQNGNSDAEGGGA